jgi:pSer/pThr/pTyr-binding forkhead associated (FHA) protein
MTSGPRLGLEDLGSAGGTFIDGARLLPEHGPRDISETRMIRFGTVELALSRL